MIGQGKLNTQALLIEECETRIREIVKLEFLKKSSKYEISNKVKKIIAKLLSQISIPDLKEACRISLYRFFVSQYEAWASISPKNLFLLLCLMRNEGRSESPKISLIQAQKEIQKEYFERTGKQISMYDMRTLGTALKKFQKDYLEKDVKPVLDKLTKQFPLDPGDVTGRNSLRNRAEMEVRYNDHLQQIEDFKAQGVRLVICSTHSDCSERCSKWQGRVYSLDGTRGVTPDGRKYVPLEEATDVYYTTKAGKRYKNGLLGFNCRHYLVPYRDGLRFPEPNPEKERKEYKITQKQRYLEREVRYRRTEAITSKGIYTDYYRIAKNSAIEANKEYIEYSKANNRAFFPSRTKII